MRLRGEERAVTAGQALDGRTWLELDQGAKLSIRHAKSAREVSATGPATLLPCVLGEEQFLLARGVLETTQGPGARPGAEVLVATPLGSVRYADAALVIRALGRRLEIDARTGTASIDAAEGVTLKGKAELGPKSKTTLVGNPRPAALVVACEAKAAGAENLARRVVGGADAGGTLGERAAAHVVARRTARAACTTATAASALVEEPERGRLLARVAAADRRWKAVPRPLEGLHR